MENKEEYVKVRGKYGNLEIQRKGIKIFYIIPIAIIIEILAIFALNSIFKLGTDFVIGSLIIVPFITSLILIIIAVFKYSKT